MAEIELSTSRNSSTYEGSFRLDGKTYPEAWSEALSRVGRRMSMLPRGRPLRMTLLVRSPLESGADWWEAAWRVEVSDGEES